MTFVIPFPAIDPILFQFGPIAIRWYALAYIAGLLIGWRYMRIMAVQAPIVCRPEDIDDFLVWVMLGVVLGGRLGYVLFYNFDYYAANPAAILQVWRGGMSFHGGFIGVAVMAFIFLRRRGIPLLPVWDMLAAAAPVGLFFGRIANFINGELFGRITDVSWAVVFPRGGPSPRHPSQLYEAVLEGLVLFVLIYLLRRVAWVRNRPGVLTGVFLIGYGAARSIVELFRQPDAHIGFLLGGSTMGQWLSVPMVALGVYFILAARARG